VSTTLRVMATAASRPPEPLPGTTPQANRTRTILPLGDSITFGDGSSDGAGYRSHLFALALAHGQSLTFVGSHNDGPALVSGQPFPAAHEAHPGCTIGGGSVLGVLDMAELWLHRSPADLVLLLIGTNDLNFGHGSHGSHDARDIESAPERLGRLLDVIAEHAPRSALFVAQLIPSRDDVLNQEIERFNAALPPLVAERRRAGRDLTLVDLHTPLVRQPDYKQATLVDRLHPSDLGHALIAQAFFDALRSRL
jgi:lysophospholipase L1-like esterase